MKLNLGNAVDFILDRIFDGDDVKRLTVDFMNECVKCRRLAAAGWPNNKQNPLRTADHRMQVFFASLRQAELGDRQYRTFPAENAQDNFFAPARRQNGYSDVVVAGNVSVLRCSLLG